MPSSQGKTEIRRQTKKKKTYCTLWSLTCTQNGGIEHVFFFSCCIYISQKQVVDMIDALIFWRIYIVCVTMFHFFFLLADIFYKDV